MAIIDRRLLPFIEVLADLGMDWLAFELLDGIRRGVEPAEHEHALARAREQSGQPATDQLDHQISVDPGATPIRGDEQLDWAIEYTFDQLTATLAEMSLSLDALDEILDEPGDRRQAASTVEPLLVLLDDGEERTVRRTQVETAQARLPELRAALDTWRRSTPPELDQ